MKKPHYIILILIATTLIFMSCTKSPKTILLSEDSWLIGKIDEDVENSNNQTLQFIDDKTVTFGEESYYDISWIDDFTFKLSMNEKEVIFKFGDFENDKIKVAILYENEKAPVTEEEWSKLQNEDRVVQLVKKNNAAKLSDFYIVNGEKTPVAKVPPAGLYLTQGGLAINVIIKNGVVKFQAGEDRNRLIDIEANIIFEGLVPENISLIDFLNNWDYGSCEYVGNGVIENSGYMLNGNSGGSVEFVRINSSANDDKNIISEYTKRALDYGFIFKDEENLGVLIIKQFTETQYNNGVVLKVPDGKIWTPLYFEKDHSKDCWGMPSIYPVKSQDGGGWFLPKGYYFPIKPDFISYKYSKRNTKALAGEFAVLCEKMYCKNLNVSFTLYFLEE